MGDFRYFFWIGAISSGYWRGLWANLGVCGFCLLSHPKVSVFGPVLCGLEAIFLRKESAVERGFLCGYRGQKNVPGFREAAGAG